MLFLVLLAMPVDIGAVAQAGPAVHLQVAFVVDGSDSIDVDEWHLITEGLASAIEDPCITLHNGSVELWVIQFAGSTATLEVDATIIDGQATAHAVGDYLRNDMLKRGGKTPTGEGFRMARERLITHMDSAARQIIGLISDGHPQPMDVEVPEAIAERNAAIEAGIDEIDCVALDVQPEWIDWLRDEVVYPEPGVLAPPYPDPPGSRGWVRLVATLEQFEGAISLFDTVPEAEFRSGPLSGAEPLTVVFTDLSTSCDGVVSWVWGFGDGATSSEQNPRHEYGREGTYTVTLTVTEADGDTDTMAKTDYITVWQEGVVAQGQVSPDGATTIETKDGRISVKFGVGAVADVTVVTIREETPGAPSHYPAGFKAGSTFFTIGMAGDLVPGRTITITSRYSAADLDAGGGDPGLLRLSRWDEDEGKWIVLPTVLDAGAGTLTVTTDRLGRWIVIAEVGESLPGWAWGAIAAAPVLLLVLSFRVRRRVTRG
jgi:hypothetical protein